MLVVAAQSARPGSAIHGARHAAHTRRRLAGGAARRLARGCGRRGGGRNRRRARDCAGSGGLRPAEPMPVVISQVPLPCRLGEGDRMSLGTRLDAALDRRISPGSGFAVHRRLPEWPSEAPRMDRSVVLVTGAASGVGLAAGRRLVNLGLGCWRSARTQLGPRTHGRRQRVITAGPKAFRTANTPRRRPIRAPPFNPPRHTAAHGVSNSREQAPASPLRGNSASGS
jgi:hypothetical protein